MSAAAKLVVLPRRWEPRPYQRDLWCYLEGGGRRADVVAHRRWGKDEVALNWAAAGAVRARGDLLAPAAGGEPGPQSDLGRGEPAHRPAADRRGVSAQIRKRTRDAEMMIHFSNGSTWQVVGSDNFNSLVGSPPMGVVFSEWSLGQAGGLERSSGRSWRRTAAGRCSCGRRAGGGMRRGRSRAGRRDPRVVHAEVAGHGDGRVLAASSWSANARS